MSKAVKGLVLSVALWSVSIANPLQACENKPPPPEAIAIGATQVAYDICPTVSDISADGKLGKAKLYRGIFWDNNNIPELSVFSNNPDGSLAIPYPAGLATVPRSMVPGPLPLLAGDHGFFVEFDASISDDNSDHFPAVWLLPIEHNLKQEDSYPPDERGFERWLELDVDEGGFTPGPMGTALSWSGVWPHYERIRSVTDSAPDSIPRRLRFHSGMMTSSNTRPPAIPCP
jgi:hypothetical protein